MRVVFLLNSHTDISLQRITHDPDRINDTCETACCFDLCTIDLETRIGAVTRTVSTLSESFRLIVIGLVGLTLYCDIEAVQNEHGPRVCRRVSRTKPSPNYDAGDRFGRLPEIIPLDFPAFAEALEHHNRHVVSPWRPSRRYANTGRKRALSMWRSPASFLRCPRAPYLHVLHLRVSDSFWQVTHRFSACFAAVRRVWTCVGLDDGGRMEIQNNSYCDRIGVKLRM